MIYWTPVIGPGNLTLFNGKMFPEWDGPAFVCGLSKKPLVWITFDGKGGATAVDRWDPVRQVAAASPFGPDSGDHD